MLLNMKSFGVGSLITHIISASPPGKYQALTIIATLVSVIGVCDYLVGIHISLSVFYLIPILLASVWMGWRTAVAVAVVCLISRLLGDYLGNDSQPLPLWTWWNALSAETIFMLMILTLTNFLSLHRNLEGQVTKRTLEYIEASQARRRLEADLLEVSARERESMGHELHDDICQHFVGVALAAKVLARSLSTEGNTHAPEAESIVQWVEQGIYKVRGLARGLLSSEITPSSLAEKIAEIATEANNASLITQFNHQGDVPVIDAEAAAQVFRIAQEAVRNAVRHSGARYINILLNSDASGTQLTIQDDGTGFQRDGAGKTGMGIRIMTTRADYIGGTLSVSEAAVGGTQVRLDLPRNVKVA